MEDQESPTARPRARLSPVLMIKHGVRLRGLRPEMVLGATVVRSVLASLGYDAIVTSCTEGRHSSTSLHYSGGALDFRSRFMPEHSRQRVRDLIAEALGPEFDVVLEDTHFHVEWQPSE